MYEQPWFLLVISVALDGRARWARNDEGGVSNPISLAIKPPFINKKGARMTSVYRHSNAKPQIAQGNWIQA